MAFQFSGKTFSLKNFLGRVKFFEKIGINRKKSLEIIEFFRE